MNLSNEQWFRYDLVWEKSASDGCLNAKQMPMIKHEMIYVLYAKLPLYDIRSHNHKFINTREPHQETTVYGDLGINTDHLKHDPPLPSSVIKSEIIPDSTYGSHEHTDFKGRNGLPRYDPPLPTSVIKMLKPCIAGADHPYGNTNGSEKGSYDSPLPTSVLQFKSDRGKHKTQKPTTMMNWILKYYSKEGDIVVDPTMGSGITGVSCKSMNREFIGIEMDE